MRTGRVLGSPIGYNESSPFVDQKELSDMSMTHDEAVSMGRVLFDFSILAEPTFHVDAK